MAKVEKWTPFGVALDIIATGGSVVRISATQFTVVINASWETYYSGASTNYGMSATAGGVTKVISAFGTARSSGSGSFTGTFSISGNGSATKSITVTFKNFNSDNGKSATKTVSFSVTVPAWTSYAVKYNANGGTGAPSSQTKWKNQTLTLSSTQPTRTGYTFKGWATSASGSVAYASGASYTANAAVTLYAVWQAITYTVSYNANGGTGAPSNQTKTYGAALTLSSTKPTRENYTFKGWGTSASSTTVAYASGASYTNNAAVTLYAIWELSYVKPRIFNLSVERCTYNGTLTDDGTYARVSFDWETDRAIDSCGVMYKLIGDTAWTSSTIPDATGTSGSVSRIVGGASLDPEKTYDFQIVVIDSGGTTYATDVLHSMVLPIDALAGGKGVSFGKAAELEGVAEFAFDAKFNNPVYGKTLGMDRLPAIPSNSNLNDYITTGCYSVQSNAVAASCTNIPVDRAGRLEVWSATGEGIRAEQWSYLRQRFIPYNSENAVWERDITRGEDNVWRFYDWYRSSLTPTASKKVYHDQKILWGADLASGMYMTAGHTANLTEAISAQPNGIVLVFSAYESADDTNYGWQCFFVPKQLVALSTSGHTFELSRGKHTRKGTKYLYIYDDHITGHADNNLTGTSNGITYANNKFVLRYVFGV
jgi:uncharacterized repeat protein (TIGR02543 family)